MKLYLFIMTCLQLLTIIGFGVAAIIVTAINYKPSDCSICKAKEQNRLKVMDALNKCLCGLNMNCRYCQEAEDISDQYPKYICYECGTKHGQPDPESTSTFHIGWCAWCKKHSSVTDTRDYGCPDFNGKSKRDHD